MTAIIMPPLFGFALAVAYVPWITGAASTPRWAVLVILAVSSLFALSFERKISRRDWPWGFAALFGTWALLSAEWSIAPEAHDQVWKLLLLAALFWIGSRLSDLRMRGLLVGCALGVGISSALVILDRLGLVEYAQWELRAGPGGLFANGLYLAEFAAMVMVGCLAYRRWSLAALCVPSIALVHLPRGPLVALFVAAWVSLGVRRVSLWISFGIVLVFAVWLVALLRPDTVNIRFDQWRGIISHLTIMGHGLGAYFGDAPLLATVVDTAAGRPPHANNDLLEIAYDTGLIGLALALAFLASLLWARRQVVKASAFEADNAGSNPAAPAKLVVVVFLVEGLFSFPFHMPATAGLFALAAGYLVKR